MDFTKICRACSKEKHILIKLSASDQEDELTLGEMLYKCTKIDIYKEDDVPQNICFSCAKQLEAAFRFIKMCLESEENFQNITANSISSEVQTPSPNLEKYDDNEIHYELIYLSKNEEESDFMEIHDSSAEIILTSDKFNSDRLTSSEEYNADRLQESVEQKQNQNDCNNSNAEKLYNCNNCDKSFFTERALKLHIKALHRLLNEHSKLTITSEERESEVEFAVEKEYKSEHKKGRTKFVCKICGKRLQDENKLQIHLKIHSKDNRHFKCQICGKNFTEERYLQRHVLYHRPVVFKCTEKGCNQKYTMKYKYVDHLRRHHRKILTNCQVRKLQSTIFSSEK